MTHTLWSLHVRNALLVLVLIAGLGMLAACSGESGPEATPADNAAPAADGSTAADPGESANVAMNIINASPDDTICWVYVSSSDDDAWGADRLGETQTLPPGESTSFEVAADRYDIRLEDCDQNVLLQTNDVAVTSAYDVRFSGLAATDAVLTISNQASTPICRVLFSASDDDAWGVDRLGVAEQIDAGDERAFPVASGTYDVRLHDCEETVLHEEFAVEIASDYTLRYAE